MFAETGTPRVYVVIELQELSGPNEKQRELDLHFQQLGLLLSLLIACPY